MDGTNDHVHVLVAVPPDVTVAAIVHRMKGYSARFVNARIASGGIFRWQEGYGAFSISQSDIPGVVRYIRDQSMHHGVNEGHLETESGATNVTEPEGFPRIQTHSAPQRNLPPPTRPTEEAIQKGNSLPGFQTYSRFPDGRLPGFHTNDRLPGIGRPWQIPGNPQEGQIRA